MSTVTTYICDKCQKPLPDREVRDRSDDYHLECYIDKWCDTRYGNGVAAWYAAHMAFETHIDAQDLVDMCRKFVDEKREYHENNRHEFKPHPNWKKKIAKLIVTNDVTDERSQLMSNSTIVSQKYLSEEVVVLSGKFTYFPSNDKYTVVYHDEDGTVPEGKYQEHLNRWKKAEGWDEIHWEHVPLEVIEKLKSL